MPKAYIVLACISGWGVINLFIYDKVSQSGAGGSVGVRHGQLDGVIAGHLKQDKNTFG